MDREQVSFKSAHLSKEVKMAIYGHYGFALLMFPTFTDDCLENEKNSIIESIEKIIHKGKCTVFSIEGINKDSWFNENISTEEKSQNHWKYNNFILEEVLPYIFGKCGGPVPVITCGAAIGAFHAANTYFRRPDIFYGVIAMSGTFNIEHFTKGYFDDNCYFNSPIHYLPNLTDNYWLSFLKSKRHCYILSGSGNNEYPGNSVHLGQILQNKGIPNKIDIWGPEWHHEYKTWKAMLPQILETRL